MASNLLEGKVFVKISELDPTVGFAAEDEFVLVQNGVTLKTTGLDITDSVISIGNLANKPYVDGAIIALINGAPGILDTLDELATALNDDANFAGTITTIVNTKLASGDFGLRFWEELAQVNTYHIAEGINLYWTQERFDTALAAKNTFHIAEGSNLYFTEQRVLDVVTPLVPTSIFDLGVPEVGTPENIPGYLYYNGTDLSWRAVDGSYPTAPTFSSVTTTQLNVQSVTFTGTGAVTISSGNDLNLSAVGNVSINGNTIGNLAYADNVSFVEILDVNGLNGPEKISIGKDSGSGQGDYAVSIGISSGVLNQGRHSVAIGNGAGSISQSLGATALGAAAGYDNQGVHSVALGFNAGMLSQGVESIAIGHNAGFMNQAANTIILSALGETQLNGILGQTNSFYVAPIREAVATPKSLFYNTTTKEVTTATLAAVATSGSYTDLTNKPTLFSGSYNDLTNKPTLFQIGIKEPISTRTGATGVVNHDMSTANIFNHSNLAGNFTCNLINLSLPTNNAISVTLIINQGATPYMPTAFQIGGVAQTINWLNSIAPAGSASKIDVASFSILNNSGTYTVLGSLSTFG